MAEEQETVSPEKKARRACLGHSDIQESSDLQQDRVSQQSPRKHTVRRDQSQVVQNVSIGDHSAVFLGSATGITVNQAVIKKVTGKPDPDQAQAAAREAEEALRKVYTTTGSYVQMLPWFDDDKRHIMDIYTKLCLVEQVDTRGKFQREKKKMQSYEEMFRFETRDGSPIKRVVISGSAGIGKTTLIDKIAYDWALGDSETLNKYKLAFVLKMRSLKQSSDLVGAIFDHLLDKDVVDQSGLNEFINKNHDKVLILLDGYDEFKIAELDTSSFGSIFNILNRKQGRECWVVITSRPPLDKLVNSSLVEKPYTHVTVEGFSKKDKKKYVNNFFHNDDDKASKLIEQIELSDTLSDLARSPMLLLLMCLLWDAQKTLPDTMTRLYNKALKYIFKRKTKDIKEDAISDILIAIGRVALDHLISKDDSFTFREGDFEKSALDAAINAGVLTSERVNDGFDTYQQVLFMHHTFLEYCAAMYWQSLIKTAKFKRILDQISIGFTERTVMTSRYEYLFRFCCGDNEACTHRILKKVHQDSELALLCYFESQSKELPPKEVICSVFGDRIVFANHIKEHQKTLFYFMNRLTALSRGNDHFTKVKKLHLDFYNLLSDGKDLEWTKLMTNLQSLELVSSSLTTATTNKILSSLAKPSRLTELNLSGNKALGGSVSLLVPQLKKLKCLKELSLNCSSLVAEDVSPIAESIGDTLVDLDVSRNPALGGCASIWGPPLGKMEYLQNIRLRQCSLKGTDIEPIALGLSGIQTLVHLNLFANNALGGCAEMWALHLKSMRHLEGVDLGYCNLTVGDMEPIAKSVSDMPTLIHLDLSFNKPLNGFAPSWAHHLMQMTKHLKKLLMFGLTYEDKEYINASTGLKFDPHWRKP